MNMQCAGVIVQYWIAALVINIKAVFCHLSIAKVTKQLHDSALSCIQQLDCRKLFGETTEESKQASCYATSQLTGMTSTAAQLLVTIAPTLPSHK